PERQQAFGRGIGLPEKERLAAPAGRGSPAFRYKAGQSRGGFLFFFGKSPLKSYFTPQRRFRMYLLLYKSRAGRPIFLLGMLLSVFFYGRAQHFDPFDGAGKAFQADPGRFFKTPEDETRERAW